MEGRESSDEGEGVVMEVMALATVLLISSDVRLRLSLPTAD